jgi:hypothetical protein
MAGAPAVNSELSFLTGEFDFAAGAAKATNRAAKEFTMPDVSPHPTPQALTLFGHGRLPEVQAAAVAAHLETCPACRNIVAELPADSFLSRVRAARPNADALAPAPPPADVPPELARHPKFRVIRELGRGGMGVIYLAEHRVMEKPVALKVISPAVLDNAGALARFQAEVKAAGLLDHPNIARAYDADRAGELHFLVMEFIEGQSLAHLLAERGPLSVATACDYARQAALGLQHASEQGMTHRDVKPHNLMLTPAGVVKVLDFGLARVRGERPASPRLTQFEAFMGTPEYVAPEQATDARCADTRSDIYSLGCTLYALLTGRPPFQQDTVVKLVLAHIEREPRPLHEVRPDVPANLSAVVARMLAKDPARRFQRPVDGAQALAPFAVAEGKSATGGAPRSTTVTLASAATLVEAAPTRMEGLGQEEWPSRGPAGSPAPGPRQTRLPMLAGAAVILALAAGVWLLFGAAFRTGVEVADGEAPVVPESGRPDAEGTVEAAPAPTRLSGPGQAPGAVSMGYVPANAGDALRGQWRAQGTELVQAGKTPTYLFFGDKAWDDYDLELEGMPVESPGKFVATPEVYKVLFRAEDGRNFHALGLGSYGGTWHEVFRVEDGNWVQSDAALPTRLERDHWYRARVQARGNRFVCFVDGKKVFNFTDDHFPRGRVGLSTWNTACRFRNIKVADPSGRVLLQGVPDLDDGGTKPQP